MNNTDKRSPLDRLFDFVLFSEDEIANMSRDQVRDLLIEQGIDPDAGKAQLELKPKAIRDKNKKE